MSREGTDVLIIVAPDVVSIVALFGGPTPLELGALKLVVFGRLKNSARKDSTDSPGKAKFLKIDASYCRNASDCRVFAFTCP
jgi:hypothetical protein